MNREIKFRAFCIADGEKQMVVFENGQFDNGYWFSCPAKIAHIDEYLSPLMQFTGLLDKNGNEIYERDIVRCVYGTGEVVYSAGCPMVQWIDDKEAMMEFVFSKDGKYNRRHEDELFEIIGNIYEHPQLLNP